MVRRRRLGLFAHSLGGFPDGFLETDGDLRELQLDQVIPKLARHVIAGGLAISDLHARGPGLWAASMAFVSRSTESQNSSSASSLEARPSSKRPSSSSCDPSKPGAAAISTAATAASRASWAEGYAPALTTAWMRCSCSGVSCMAMSNLLLSFQRKGYTAFCHEFQPSAPSHKSRPRRLRSARRR